MQLTHSSQVQTETINGHTVSYVLKANRKDIAHLVVVFNGYRHHGWDFGNPINFLKCNILMIVDVFKNQQSCYMGKDGNFEFNDVVACLIEKILERLGLTKQSCTLIGASKGGYAALYFGVKYNFPNIVSSAPFGYLGKWMKDYNDSIAKHVMGQDFDNETIDFYNQLAFNIIRQDKYKDKNIYMFISEQDHFYQEYGQKELLLTLLNHQYSNFNLIYTKSDLAFQHNQVTAYFLQEILAIINLLSHGVATKFEQAIIDDTEYPKAVLLPNATAAAIMRARNNQILLPEKPKNEINVLKIQNHRLYLEGILYIQNYHQPDHQSLHKQLRLTNIHTGEQQEILLGTVPKAENSRELYQNAYFNYRGSGVATVDLKGIDVSHLPNGAYKLELSVSKQGFQPSWQDIVFNGNLDLKIICDDSEYSLSQRKNSIYLIKKPIIGHLNQECLFELKNRWSEKNTFHVEGEFVVQGAAMPEFHMGNYYLLARNIHTGQCYSYGLGMVRSPELCKKLGDIYQNYLACYFATMHFKGIETTDWQGGEYELFISLSFGGEIYSKKLDERLQVKTNGCVFV